MAQETHTRVLSQSGHDPITDSEPGGCILEDRVHAHDEPAETGYVEIQFSLHLDMVFEGELYVLMR